MPIIDLQRSLRRLGRIRMGEKKMSDKGKEFPAKLTKWRLTSPSRDLLAAAADLYGGEVKQWAGAPTEGQQFELYTDTDSLDILIPPHDMAFSQWYELWSGGGCARRCDGQWEQLANEPCSCPVDTEEKQALAAKGQACKPTTRLFVVLPRVPDIGMWHAEFHGFYAAVEIPGVLEIMQRLSSATGAMVPAHLRIDQRTSKHAGETRHYTVPVIELRGLSAATLLTGEMPAGAVGMGDQPALPSASHTQAGREARPELPRPPSAAPAGPSTSPAFVRNIRSVATKAGLDAAALDALVAATVEGKTRLDEIHGPAEANAVLAKIGELRTGGPFQPTTPAAASAEKPSDAQLRRIHAELRRQGVTDEHARLGQILNRTVGSIGELSRNDAKVVLDALAAAGPFDDKAAS